MLCVLCLVLYAMKEDSEKVPTLLTDYILKGKSKYTGLRSFSCLCGTHSYTVGTHVGPY